MPQVLTDEEQQNAVKTWRYLRISMIVLVAGLGYAIVREIVRKGCVQGSISAYFYTPARGFFVGALVAIGVCLVAVKGNTPREDVLLNLAGAFAPVVAFVPTPDIDPECASITLAKADRVLNVGNNFTTLLVVGAAGLVLTLFFVKKQQPGMTEAAPVGWLSAAAVWVIGFLAYNFAPGTFDDWAHMSAAVLMFACILGAVISNAKSSTSYGRAYTRVAYAMGASIALFLLAIALDLDYRVLGIEAAMIALFAVFWAVQTRELWHQGLR